MLQTERITESAASESRAHILREIVQLEHAAHPDKVSASETELREMLLRVYELTMKGGWTCAALESQSPSLAPSAAKDFHVVTRRSRLA